MRRLIYNLIYNVLVVTLSLFAISAIDRPTALMVYLVLIVLTLAIFAILRKLYYFIFVKDRWLFIKTSSDIEKGLWGVTPIPGNECLSAVFDKLKKIAFERQEKRDAEKQREYRNAKALQGYIEKCNRR